MEHNESKSFKKVIEKPKLNLVCACLYQGSYYRAKIIKVIDKTGFGTRYRRRRPVSLYNSKIVLQFMEFGNTYSLPDVKTPERN
eukprot:UN29057